jgi:O-methyltransferase involved in polyketide biosynthesis
MMEKKEPVQLGKVQESLLVPLYARAIDSRRKHPVLNDRKAEEIVQSIDWDFERFAQRNRMAGCILRTLSFDEFVKSFLSRHPQGTVVEIGAGLNTRFERLDNGAVHWFDLDLPDSVAMRRRFFADSERRTTLAASILDSSWIAAVCQSPGPYCFVAEAVLIYLAEQDVKAALGQIAANFPGASIAFDTITSKVVERANKDHASKNLGARFAWACEAPEQIESWRIGLRLVASRSIGNVPATLRPRLSLSTRIVLSIVDRLIPQMQRAYRINLFTVQSQPGLQSLGPSPN